MATEEDPSLSEESPNRSLRVDMPTSSDISSEINIERWAIVVGISKYKYERWNLKYADCDAEAVYKLLRSPLGGEFKADHIVKLTNQEATTANIIDALRSFLRKPAPEDIVLIYFACHGSPDFDNSDIVYLLTHDTNPRNISGTALLMREIKSSLQDFLRAERVIVLADTCHSAAIGDGMGRRSTTDNAQLVNRYLAEASKARKGVALLTSAEEYEVSFEDAKWGGGHGVFTHYLLKGMQGEADRDRDGVVTVGELFDYVSDKVKEATKHRQNPFIGNNRYDRNLPIAIIKTVNRNPDEFPNPIPNPIPAQIPTPRLDKRILLPLASIGGGVFIVALLFSIILNYQTPTPTPVIITPIPTPSPTSSRPIDLGVLKDYEIRIYYNSNRRDLETKANAIKTIFDPKFAQSNISINPKPADFFSKEFPFKTPANEIRHTEINIDGANYLKEILKKEFPSDEYNVLPIGNQDGKYVSIFLGP